MKQYLDALKDIMVNGVDREGRNGITRAVWVKQLRFNLQDGFPAVTTKKLAFKMVLAELLWFIQGPTKNGRMDDEELKRISGRNRTIWTDNAEANYWADRSQFPGDLGRVYGCQWRDWKRPDGKSFDQLAWAIDQIKHNPFNRKIVVSAFNPGEIDQMALEPCHMIFHFFVAKGKLSLHMLQRSCDMFLGVPFNIASYAILLHMIAQVTELEVGELVITLDDAHIYENHFEQVKEQLKRTPLKKPTLWLNPDVYSIDDFTMDDVRLENYEHMSSIKAEMSV